MYQGATKQADGKDVPVYGPLVPAWVTSVPSLRRPDLIPAFARRLATRLSLPYIEAVQKILDRPPQKEQQNSYYRLQNLRGAFKVHIPDELKGQPVLLVDDVIDSGWTFTWLVALLLREGSGPVYPLALAEAIGR